MKNTTHLIVRGITSMALGLALIANISKVNAEQQSSPVNDSWLKTKVVTSYALNQHLSPFTIDTEVNQGQVTLSGEVENSAEKELAERIALSVEGVTNVNNKLNVKEDVARKPNAFFKAVNDATTATSVYTKLASNQNLSVNNLAVTTSGGIVKLTGNVSSDTEKELAEMVALDTSGVRRVDNQLSVTAEKPSTAKKVEHVISDSWISTKVYSNILFSDGTSGSDVDIDTKAGVVTLKGSARNTEQRELIRRIAKDVTGVKDVSNQLVVASAKR